MLKLRPHQEKDLEFFKRVNKTIDGSKPGTGKTAPACKYIWWLWEEKGVKTILACGLKSIMGKNKEELLEWSGFDSSEIAIVSGTVKAREKQFNNPHIKVYIMGADCLANNWRRLRELQSDVDALVYDEIHMACGNAGTGTDQDPGTQRSLAILAAGRTLTYFHAMSGSLVDGTLGSVYVPIKVVAPLVYPSYQNFLVQHATLDNYGKPKRWYGHEKVEKILNRFWVNHSFEEVYGKESDDIVFRDKIDMSEGMRRSYKELEEAALLELGDGTIMETANEGVNLCRCRQVMSCPEIFGLKFETPKDDVLKSYIDGSKMLICCAYKQEQLRVKKILEGEGLRVGLINSDVNDKKRVEIDLLFRQGQLDVVVGGPQTMAVGFNWQFVDHVIFTSLTYKDTDFVQAIRRANRGSRNKPLRVTIMEYDKSIDQMVWNIIAHKAEESRRVDTKYPSLFELERRGKKVD